MCRDCKRSFTVNTNTVGFMSHENYEKWLKFIECEINGLSHRKTACIVGIANSTALLWRHKFYDALGYMQEQKLSGQIQVDAKNIPINFTGCIQSKMPRSSKKRKSNKSTGKNNHTSCVISATDEEDHIILKLGGYGKETAEMYVNTLQNNIAKGSILITDGFMGFEEVASHFKCHLEIVKSECRTNDNGFNINTVNGVHSELETFMKRYRGVATRHLQGYLNMFVLRKYLTYHFKYSYHKREAFISGMPHQTTITKSNEHLLPYLNDMNEVYSDYHTEGL